MTAFLLALGSCGDALEATAAQAALAAAGARCDVAWFGPHDRLCDARALGLPEPAAAAAAPATASAERCEAVASFAAELLRRPWRAVVTLGHGDFVTALGRAALAAGTPVVRLAAGLRTHAAGDPHDDARRAADHAASHWLCDREARRHELLAEGCDPARITVPGSLLAAALAARTGHAAGEVVVAFERAAAFAAPDRLVRQLTALAAVGAPVRLLPTPQARAFLARHPETIAGVRMSPDGDGPGQLAELLGARLVVTDSVGHQRLAHARGLRCVVAARAGVLADALAAGGFAVAGDDDDGLAAAARRALADAPPPAEAAAAAAARTADALLAIAADPSPARIVLPSDGDCTGRTLGAEEAILAADAVRRGTLNSTRGVYVQAFERRFAAWLGRKHAIACASGSAAMHCAIAALRLQAGDEVVTTPITDMGALTPILYEGGVPVFADVDPTTLNVTPATVAARITDRTRAIVVTHLFGRPVDLDGFAALAHAHGLPLIEDAAQAFGATWRDRRIGGFGALACFSLQQGKHITTGEGGIVATDDDDLARRVFLYVNKAWGYGDKKPDHYFPALNYRLTEVQGAIALAQLPKLDGVVAARRRVAAMLQHGLADLPGIGLPGDPPHGCHAWWKFAFRVDAEVVPGGALALGQRMQQAGVACVPRYVQKPAFECELFRDWSRSPVTAMPLAHNPRGAGPQPPFRREDFPGAVRGLEQVVVLPINERYEARHVDHVCDAIRAGVGALQHA